MIIDLGLLIGLISIALALFFGIFFGLREFTKGISDQLSNLRKNTEPIGDIRDKISGIGERIITIQGTTEKVWDLLSTALTKGGTVERNLENLGKIKITAEPGPTTTSYLIELEKPVLRESILLKKVQELDFNLRSAKIEEELDSILREVRPVLPLKQRVEAIRIPSLLSATVYSSQKLRCHVNSTDPGLCTELITFFLKWLNSAYISALDEIKRFEEPILS